MKKNTRLQLLLSLALGSQVFYIVIASLGDLKQNIPTFLVCYGALFVLYWVSGQAFFGLSQGHSQRKVLLPELPFLPPALRRLQVLFDRLISDEKFSTREIVIIGLVFGLVFRVTMLITTPSLSDDIYRYLWDGKIANSGINPYLYPPNAQALESLRDSEHYPRINHKEVSTIYPPVSQLMFRALANIGASVLSFKVGFLIFDLLTITALLLLLQSLRIPSNRALLYVWNPLVIVEFTGNGHADVIGIFFLTSALWLLASKRLHLANIALAFSFLTKFITILFLPMVTALKKNNRILIVLVFIMLTAALYLPFARAGEQLFSGFFVYTSKWQFNGSIFSALLTLLQNHLPTSWVIDLMITPHGFQPDAQTIATRTLDLALLITKVIVAVTFVGLYAYLFMRLREDLKREGRIWLFRLGVILFGALFLLSPTVQPWYLCWMLPFLVVVPNRAFILLTGMVALSYWILVDYTARGVWQESSWVRWVEYLPFYSLLLYDYFAKRVRRRRLA